MKNQETLIKVDIEGVMSFIYSDDMVDLSKEGRATITRASHVEPSGDGKWHADMSPVGGPVLSGFDLRKDALEAEISYLKGNLFGGSRNGRK